MKKIITLSALLFLCCTILSAKSEPVIKHQGNLLKIKTIVASWDEQKSRIVLSLFPYQLTDEEIKKVRKGYGFIVMMNKKSPGSYWKQPLYAKLEIELKNQKDVNKFDSIHYLYWNFIWFNEKNKTSFSSIPASNLDKTMFKNFKCILKSEGNVELQYKGKMTIEKKTYEWDIDFKGTLQLE